jgi:hypothetical protein
LLMDEMHIRDDIVYDKHSGISVYSFYIWHIMLLL